MRRLKIFSLALLAAGLVFAVTGCDQPGGDTDIRVTFNSVTADGSATSTTTQLTLVFSQAVTGLSVANVSVSGVPGVTLGNMAGSGATRTLAISGFTGGGNLTVAVSSPTGYVISGGPLSVNIHHFAPPADTAVTFNSVTANGSATVTTTQLTLTFSQAVTGLSAANISVSGVPGVTLGTLGGSGATRTLPISGFTAGGNLNVAVTAPAGYTISGGPLSVAIFYAAEVTDTAVTFLSVTADGSATSTTTQLTLVFSQAVTGLSAANISVSGVPGVTLGTLGGTGPVYTLPISGFTGGGSLNVAVSGPTGFTVSGGPLSVTIHHVAGTGDGNNDDNGVGGDEFAEFFAPGFRNNNAGSTLVRNTTNEDMLLFTGASLTRLNIVGGVPGNSERLVNFSNLPNYNVGGWVLLRAVRVSEFATAGPLSRVDHSALATFGQGREFTTTIHSTTDGGFEIVVSNRDSRFGLEIRQGSPEGPIIAYLAPNELGRRIYFPTGAVRQLFPVWVAFNNRTRSVTTISPVATDYDPGMQAVMPVASGSPVSDIPHLDFPMGGTVNFPVNVQRATFEVVNNTQFMGQFRNAAGFVRSATSSEAINSGRTDTFELNAGTGGGTFNLNMWMNFGTFTIPVRFVDEDGETISANPRVENGFVYRVTITHLGGPIAAAASYEAVLERVGEIDPAEDFDVMLR